MSKKPVNYYFLKLGIPFKNILQISFLSQFVSNMKKLKVGNIAFGGI